MKQEYYTNVKHMHPHSKNSVETSTILPPEDKLEAQEPASAGCMVRLVRLFGLFCAGQMLVAVPTAFVVQSWPVSIWAMSCILLTFVMASILGSVDEVRNMVWLQSIFDSERFTNLNK